MAEIKFKETKKFEPITVEMTFNTFKEYETFVGRMVSCPIDSTYRYRDGHNDPVPFVSKRVFGPKSSNDISCVLYRKYKELKAQQQ